LKTNGRVLEQRKIPNLKLLARRTNTKNPANIKLWWKSLIFAELTQAE